MVQNGGESELEVPRSNGWLDIHGHFYPPADQETRQKKHKAMLDGLFIVPESSTIWSADTTLEYLDRAGVQMQMLSNIPQTLPELKSSNDFGASVVQKHPSRFGLMAALPTDDPQACLEEIARADGALRADGFAVTCCYKGVWLSDPSLLPVWEELNKRKAVVFTHPNAYAGPHLGRPSPLIEVAFETARCWTDMVYNRVLDRCPDVTFIVSHAGGALPALSGRLKLLGGESWVPNPNEVSTSEIDGYLRSLFVDTAATGSASTIGPACEMTGAGGRHIIYGSDCGVPCSTVRTLEQNRKNLFETGILTSDEVQSLGRRGFELFPRATARVLTNAVRR